MVERYFYFILKYLPILVVFACSQGCSQPAEQVSGPVMDTLCQPPAAPWTWVRENPSTHRTDNDGLHILLELGSLMGEGKDVKNILTRPLPANTLVASVTVSFEPQLQYEQAGLILYGGDDRYIKLVKEFVDNQPWIVMVSEVDAKARVINKIPAPNGAAILLLELKDTGVEGSVSSASGERLPVGSDPFPMTPRPRIGLFTQNGQPQQQRWASFRDFSLANTVH